MSEIWGGKERERGESLEQLRQKKTQETDTDIDGGLVLVHVPARPVTGNK